MVADAGSILVTLLATPYLLRALGLDSLGLIGVISVVVGQLLWFAGGLSSAVVRQVAEARGRGQTDPRRTTEAALLLGTAAGLATASLAFVIMYQFGNPGLADSGPSNRTHYATAVALMGLAQSLSLPIQAVLLGEERFARVALLRWVQASGRLLVAVLAAPLGLVAVLYAQAALDGAVMLTSLLFVRRACPHTRERALDWDRVRGLVRLGASFGGATLVLGLLAEAEKIAIAVARPLGDFAFFSVPHNAAVRLAGITTAFAATLIPRLSFIGSTTGDAGAVSLTNRATRVVVGLVTMGVCLGVAVVPELLRFWLGGDFSAASTRITRLLLVVVVVSTAGSGYNALLRARASPLVLGTIYAVQIPLYAGVLYLFLVHLSVWGAALALLLRACADLLLHRAAVRRCLGASLNDSYVLVAVTSSAALVLLMEAIGSQLLAVRVLLGVLGSALTARALLDRSDWVALIRVVSPQRR